MTRHVTAGYFGVGDVILYGRWKNKKGLIKRLFTDMRGVPMVEIEPVPKGRKQNKTFSLFKIWHAPSPAPTVPVPVEEKKAMSIASKVVTRAQRVAAGGMTADDMVAKLQRELHKFSHMLLKVDKGLKLGSEDSVYVTYSKVPKDAGELAAINSPVQFMLSIRGPKWGLDQPAPEKVKVEQFRGRGIKFRAMTGTPEKAIDNIVKFFKSNEDLLLSTEKTAMTSPLIKRIVDKVQSTTREARLVDRVVAKAKKAGLGETVERGMVRIHRFRGSFKVWDLTNAGKRGKTVKVMSVIPNIKGDEEAWMDRMENQMEMSGYDTYGKVHGLFADLLEQFPGEIKIYEQTERGVDVIPANVRTLKLEWKVKTKSGPDLGDVELRLQATPLDFHLVSSQPFAGGPERKEVYHQDTIYSPMSKADAKVFYSWAVTNEAELKKMDMDGLRKLWAELKIRVDYH